MRWLRIAVWSLLWAQKGPYFTDIEKAFREARQQKKPLWVMVSATWCGPCKVVEKQALAKPEFVQALAKDFVPLKVYAASGPSNTPGGDSLAAQYGVKAFPTFLYLEPGGQAFYSHKGAPIEVGKPLPEALLAWAQEALQARQTLSELRKRFQAGERSLDLLRSYLSYAVRTANKEEIRQVVQAYRQQAPSPRIAWTEEARMVEVLSELVALDTTYVDYVLAIADSLRPYLMPSAFQEIYWPVVLKSLFAGLEGKAAGSTEMQDSLEQRTRRWQARLPEAELWGLAAQVQGAFLSLRTLRRDSVKHAEKEAYLRLPLLRLAALWIQFYSADTNKAPLAEELNSLAWKVYEEVQASDLIWAAVGWAQYALACAPQAWHIWDTLGALYVKLNRPREAAQALRKAISLAESQGLPPEEYQSTRELLQKVQP